MSKNKLLNFFFETDNEEIIETSEVSEKKEPIPKQVNTSIGSIGSIGLIDEIEKDIWTKLKKANYESFSILQFLDIVETQIAANKDEKFKAAWNTAKILKVSLKDIDMSVKFYNKFLLDLKSKFENKLSEMTTKVTVNQSELKLLDSDQAKHEKIIQDSTEAILAIKEKRTKLSNDTESIESEVNNTKFSFDKAYEKVSDTLTSEYETIKKFGK